MTHQPETDETDEPRAAVPDGSVQQVIEYALTAYGYSPDTARTLIARLTAEARAE